MGVAEMKKPPHARGHKDLEFSNLLAFGPGKAKRAFNDSNGHDGGYHVGHKRIEPTYPHSQGLMGTAPRFRYTEMPDKDTSAPECTDFPRRTPRWLQQRSNRLLVSVTGNVIGTFGGAARFGYESLARPSTPGPSHYAIAYDPKLHKHVHRSPYSPQLLGGGCKQRTILHGVINKKCGVFLPVEADPFTHEPRSPTSNELGGTDKAAGGPQYYSPNYPSLVSATYNQQLRLQEIRRLRNAAPRPPAHPRQDRPSTAGIRRPHFP
ncbi:hypothetical protein DIPPA_31060 [Diplonema papillatum]|nr:hypothetical protein DIPPA_31060 [Diplonema papillatum]